MRTLVTGGAGFIGSHVVDRLLDEGHEVIVIDNYSTGRPANIVHVARRLTVVEADIAQPGSWVGAFDKVDWVIHLAALADIVPSIQNPEGYYRANVDGTFNVLQAANAAGVKRFVYAASSSCYGIPDDFPTRETAEMRPQYPYALTKLLGEQLVMHWAQVYDLPAVSLRFFNVYGPRSRTSGTYGAMFGVFLAQKLAGKPFTVVGNGEQSRDFTYVTDVADAVYAAAASNVTSEIMNVGSGVTVSVNRVVDFLGGQRAFIPKRPGEPDKTFADISKIRSLLGWRPKTGIETGISMLLENIDYWRDAPVWEPDSIAAATSDWFKYLGKHSA
ncbi:MAG: SDR family oxidoreductase [Alphaproteobacteria bacterium]